MSYAQLITPNPHIPCLPGWCLQYVRQTFGLPAAYPTATAAWDASDTQHRGRDFPAGLWHPVWYGLGDKEPAGHVVLRAPDGTVFSTSDNSTIPHHHPDLDDLENYYAGWGWPLTYRGWTEDVAGYSVITPTEEDPMVDPQWYVNMINAQARIDSKVDAMYNRLFGRDVQRWFNPTTMEVRGEPFDDGIPARSTDIHDVMSSNNFLAANVDRILAAVAAVPGIDTATITALTAELSAELHAVTDNLTITLTNKP